MAGHSKWSKVKHIKAVLDVRRGKLFSRLSKEISMAAKLGGGDAAMNPRLRSAVLAARAQNVPNDNIDRAIKRGTGEIEGQAYEESVYECYGPGGVAILVEVATDNRNRTAADLRSILTKNHGTLATSGSVAYLFKRKGQIAIATSTVAEDHLLEVALEAGAEEMTEDDENFLVTTSPDQLYAIAEAMKAAGLATESQKLVYLPETTTSLTDEGIAAQVLRLCEALEDGDDVQEVHANFVVADEVMAGLAH
ncbi:MAG: YebC/PmpR family DNA-binding transcriptional regulator [Chthoniobacteraceae bacterium]